MNAPQTGFRAPASPRRPRDPVDRLRPDDGHAARRPRPDDRGHRHADHRPRPRRRREPALDRHRLPAGLDGRDAALRQAQRHPRAAHHAADRHRDLQPGLPRLRGGAHDGDAGAGARAPGHRRRRPHRPVPDHHRRHHVAQGARPLPGLHRRGLRGRLGGGAAARRLPGPALPLVLHLLDQPADRFPGLRAHQRQAEAAAAPRAPPPPRLARGRAARPRLDQPAPGPELGRRALSLGIAGGDRAARCRDPPRCGLRGAAR